ncbi:MAG: NAD(P)H-hydrate epimerase [Candidatus Terraquivivens tikiterensis]|uniref:NAD(P)H-hydrate epimerase n=1 Tax=Candidatus Terraquivivens tikiterensis TaxID=1980982 RepID=A0A2R7Y1U2_9ARCH|nr:MAG: NAD(P)H-hydrate epimerase [Candidatus Terraquivivens tikiterensis]
METITSEEMAVVDENSEYLGVPRILLMENAGRAVAEHLREHLKELRDRFVVVFCGTGNNGGDGMVAARHLAAYGCRVLVVLLGSPDKIRTYEASRNFAALNSMKATVDIVIAKDAATLESLADKVKNSDAVVDGIFGTGIKGEVREPWLTAIEQINKLGRYVVAIDVPSGLDPDTGSVAGAAVKANTTITFHRPKPGLMTEEGRALSGKLLVSSIGIPPEAELVAGPGDMRAAAAYVGKGLGRLGVVLEKVSDENMILLKVCSLLCKEVVVLGQAGAHDFPKPNVRYVGMKEFVDSVKNLSTMFLEGQSGKEALAKVIDVGVDAGVLTHSYELAVSAKKHLKAVLAISSEDAASFGLFIPDAFRSVKSAVGATKELSRRLSMPVGIMADVDGISDGEVTKINWFPEPTREPTHRYLYLAVASAFLSWGVSAVRSLSAASFATRSVIARLLRAKEEATPKGMLEVFRKLLEEMKLSSILTG